MLTAAPKVEPKEKPSHQLSWKDSVAVQKVLDAVCQILAEEYCRIAKARTEIFTTGG